MVFARIAMACAMLFLASCAPLVIGAVVGGAGGLAAGEAIGDHRRPENLYCHDRYAGQDAHGYARYETVCDR